MANMTELFPLPKEPADTNEDLSALVKKFSMLDQRYINLHLRP